MTKTEQRATATSNKAVDGNRRTVWNTHGSKSDQELFHDSHAYSVETYPSASATGVGIKSDRQGKYDRLHAINEERMCAGFNVLLHEFDKRRLMQCLCNSLSVPKRQQRLCVRYLLELDLDSFGNQKRLEKVALAIIKYVMDKTSAERIKNDPYANPSDWTPLSQEPEYQELIEKLNIDQGNVMRVSQQFKKWIRNGGKPAEEPQVYLQEVSRRRREIDYAIPDLKPSSTIEWTRMKKSNGSQEAGQE